MKTVDALLSLCDDSSLGFQAGIIAAYACSARAEGQCASTLTPLEPAQLRNAFYTAQRRWHPDKFFHVFGNRVRSSEAAEIIDRVKVISQQINSEWDQMSQI